MYDITQIQEYMNMRWLISQTFAVFASVMMLSCSGNEKLSEMPDSGTVVYDIYYSGNIRDMSVVGKMLPSTVKGVYSDEGIKLNSSIGLGMVKVTVVSSTEDSFIALDMAGDKILVPFCDIFTKEDLMRKDSIVTTEGASLEEVAGWQCRKFNSSCATPWGDVNIESYYVPMPQFTNKLKDSPVDKVPGFITAIKITTRDSGIMVMLKELSKKEIDKSEFVRPSGYRAVKRDDVDLMLREQFNLDLDVLAGPNK